MAVQISERSVSALAKIVSGDSQISPYKSGPVLVRLFNEFGSDDVCCVFRGKSIADSDEADH